LTAASRDYGLTEGTTNTAEISLTDLGRRLAFAATPEEEDSTRREAFLNVQVFRDVLGYYKDSQLPEMKYLRNTLESKFKLDPSTHEEFAELFRKNCEFTKIKEGVSSDAPGEPGKTAATASAANGDFVTVAEPEEDKGLLCFVAMPFNEKHPEHPAGFFQEVLRQIVAPAGRQAGFRVVTARKLGSDVIHATIINGLLNADLVVADLTEHNPNVLFELGVRMAEDKPVALIRAMGTKAIFDVDQMLRVEEYNPCLWPSTVANDVPKIAAHIEGTWKNRENSQTYMKILRSKSGQDVRVVD
jgi:nucleoside 2-deoxyribosyltransferase